MSKLIQWLPLFLASGLGIVQAVLKFLKEVLTAVVNVLFPVMTNDKHKALVLKVRDIVNKIDEWIEKIKGYFIK